MNTETSDIGLESRTIGHSTVIRKGAKLNRNDPCNCGSGKKYKNCCKKYH